MGHITNRYNIDEEIELGGKTLPSNFATTDNNLSFEKALIISAILHPVVFGAVWLTLLLCNLLGINLFTFEKPPMQPKDIEFVLVNNNLDPIDKNTRNRAETNSRAGGKHDPTRKVSAPSPAPSQKRATSVAGNQAPKKVVKQASPAPKQTVKQAPKAPSKPTPLSAPKPSAPRVARPSSEIPKAQIPKLAQKPTSPFSIAVPKSTQPVGKSLSYSSGSANSGGGSTSQGTTGKGTSMPSPQFSASKGTGTGAGNGVNSRGSSGSTGSGNYGNPSPGNPAGAPGVDAIRQPNWGPYMRELERRIKRNWNPPKGDSSKRVVIYFKIARDGKLLAIRVAKTSGTPLADQAAKAAVELTAPFSPLPPEYKGSSIDIDFTFDYNVLGAHYR